MKEHLTVVTRKGQVTLPVEIRRRLGLKEGDKVAFVEDEHGIQVVRPESVVARTAGLLGSEIPMASAEEERQAAEQVIADEVARRMEV
jgi:AbrB family looped-hinge helix DNA binding protein